MTKRLVRLTIQIGPIDNAKIMCTFQKRSIIYLMKKNTLFSIKERLTSLLEVDRKDKAMFLHCFHKNARLNNFVLLF